MTQINQTQPAMAGACRGIILDEVSQDLWTMAEGLFFVTIRASSPNSPMPRTYKNVPWPYTSGLDMWMHRPRAGDYADIIFKDGNSELPTIVAHHPGDNTVAARIQSIIPRAIVPVANIMQSAWNMSSALSPLLTPFGFPNLTNLPSLGNIFK